MASSNALCVCGRSVNHLFGMFRFEVSRNSVPRTAIAELLMSRAEKKNDRAITFNSFPLELLRGDCYAALVRGWPTNGGGPMASHQAITTPSSLITAAMSSSSPRSTRSFPNLNAFRSVSRYTFAIN